MKALKVTAYGAKGGNSLIGVPGGLGGSISSTVTVTPGQILYILVGGAGGIYTAGFNGGGRGHCSCEWCYGGSGGGGGATDIRTSLSDLGSRLVVAAGGGGAGYDGSNYNSIGMEGGAGGGFEGVAGGEDGYYSYSYYNYGGGGGTATSGGSGGACCVYYNFYGYGSNGYFGMGGDGEYGTCGAGGGGGWYGGGGGSWNGGGGGSSYSVANAVTTAGVRSGNGVLKVSIA